MRDIPAMDIGQVPAVPPELTGRGHDEAVYDLADRIMEYGASGPVALAWRWVLTGQGPCPVSLRPWDDEPPEVFDIMHEMVARSRWDPADPRAEQVMVARAELEAFAMAVDDDEEDDGDPGPTVTATIRPVYRDPRLGYG
jgi:hypothetical protein